MYLEVFFNTGLGKYIWFVKNRQLKAWKFEKYLQFCPKHFFNYNCGLTLKTFYSGYWRPMTGKKAKESDGKIIIDVCSIYVVIICFSPAAGFSLQNIAQIK